MEPRASYQKVAPDVLQGMLALQAWGHPKVKGPGSGACRPRQSTCVTNQRMRLLPRHAFEGFACARRDGAAHLYALGLA